MLLQFSLFLNLMTNSVLLVYVSGWCMLNLLISHCVFCVFAAGYAEELSCQTDEHSA